MSKIEDKNNEIVISNCKTLLEHITAINPAFVEDIRSRYKGYTEDTGMMKAPTGHERIFESTTFDRAYALIMKMHTLCTLTSDALPHHIRQASQAEHYKSMTVVRTTAWLINIAEKGKDGFFPRLKGAKELAKEEIPTFEQDRNADVKSIRNYINDVAENFDFTLAVDEEDFHKAFEPLPLWWSPEVERMVNNVFRREMRRHDEF